MNIPRYVPRYFPPGSFILFSAPLVIDTVSKFGSGDFSLENIITGGIGVALGVTGTYDVIRKILDKEYKSSFFEM